MRSVDVAGTGMRLPDSMTTGNLRLCLAFLELLHARAFPDGHANDPSQGFVFLYIANPPNNMTRPRRLTTPVMRVCMSHELNLTPHRLAETNASTAI
jgi:hypothetical protein